DLCPFVLRYRREDLADPSGDDLGDAVRQFRRLDRVPSGFEAPGRKGVYPLGQRPVDDRVVEPRQELVPVPAPIPQAPLLPRAAAGTQGRPPGAGAAATTASSTTRRGTPRPTGPVAGGGLSRRGSARGRRREACRRPARRGARRRS